MLSTAATDHTGQVLAGKYRLVSRLGVGGMGSVWRADHLTLGSPVAIKLMDPAIAGDPGMLARFEREARAAAALRSPHVVQILDYGADGGVPFIAMEMLHGESLADRLAREGVLSPRDTARVVTHVARAIGKAHEIGVVHRDLKPDNVFLVRNDDEEIAKVLDFGIAKAEAHLAVGPGTRTGALLGTPHYMSPEQAAGNKAVDFRSDLWALAVIAFECVCGRVPIDSDGLGDLLSKICRAEVPVPSTVAPVPPAFDAWFARAAAREPEGRFASAKDAADALRVALLGDERGSLASAADLAAPPAIAPRASAAELEAATAQTLAANPTDPAPKRRPWPFVAAGVVAVAAAGAVVAARGGASDPEGAAAGRETGAASATTAPSAAPLAVPPATTPAVRPPEVAPAGAAPTVAPVAPTVAPAASTAASAPSAAPPPPRPAPPPGPPRTAVSAKPAPAPTPAPAPAPTDPPKKFTRD